MTGLPWVCAFIVRFAFSIGFAVLTRAGRAFPESSSGRALPSASSYIRGLPRRPDASRPGTVPATPGTSPSQSTSLRKFFSHIIWLWAIEVFRRDMRSRITQADAEFARVSHQLMIAALARTDG